MTPKDKARELINKFNNIDSDAEIFDGFEMKLFYAQRCALIAVDEILNTDIFSITEAYWQEVKKEIENF